MRALSGRTTSAPTSAAASSARVSPARFGLAGVAGAPFAEEGGARERSRVTPKGKASCLRDGEYRRAAGGDQTPPFKHPFGWASVPADLDQDQRESGYEGAVEQGRRRARDPGPGGGAEPGGQARLRGR